MIKFNSTDNTSIIGNAGIFKFNKLALFCSIKCPGEIILKLHEFVRYLIKSDLAVMSGFHSPVEKGVLNMLIRRKHPVIICPARSLKNMRIPKKWRQGIEEGWILVAPRRQTAQSSGSRWAEQVPLHLLRSSRATLKQGLSLIQLSIFVLVAYRIQVIYSELSV